MSIHRFYCPHSDFSSHQAAITDNGEIHHLRNVLRLRQGDQVMLFDGKGKQAQGSITSISAQKVDVQIAHVEQCSRGMPSIILACAVPKKSKFEIIVEKATELGVDEIIPLKTQRTEINLQGERLKKKISRYQTVAINAAKQSKRPAVPIVHSITDFSYALKQQSQYSVLLMPSLIAKRANVLAALPKLKSPKSVTIFIGPEGDFTPREYAQANERGAIAVSLGATTLKVETAAICTVSCVHLFYEHTKNKS